MTAKNPLDLDRIAEALGADRVGPVHASGGWFGASQLAAEVQARFHTPPGGGRATSPAWTERRLLPLAPATLRRLEHLSEALGVQGVQVTPLQVAALLLEQAVGNSDDDKLLDIARKRAS